MMHLLAPQSLVRLMYSYGGVCEYGRPLSATTIDEHEVPPRFGRWLFPLSSIDVFSTPIISHIYPSRPVVVIGRKDSIFIIHLTKVLKICSGITDDDNPDLTVLSYQDTK